MRNQITLRQIHVADINHNQVAGRNQITLRMIQRRYQTHSQGMVIIKRLPNIAANPRHRASHPLPTNTTS